MSFFGFGKRKVEKPLILVVDDELDFFLILSSLFLANGYEVIHADSKRDALKAARNQKPNIILMDIRLSKPDEGMEALAELKADPGTRAIPILMVSGQQVMSQVEKAFALGAAGYVIKPFHNDSLLKKIKEALEKKPPS